MAKINNAKNQVVKSTLKTAIKKVDSAVVEGNNELADSMLKSAVKTIDQATAKGILHKNTAARRKSSLTIKVNGMNR